MDPARAKGRRREGGAEKNKPPPQIQSARQQFQNVLRREYKTASIKNFRILACKPFYSEDMRKDVLLRNTRQQFIWAHKKDKSTYH